jgi:hypothetical protein
MRLIDHAAGRVGARAAKDAGYDGAIRYLANSPERGLPNKILTPEEAKEYIDLGMPLVSNWQKGKHETADWRRGYDGGVADARAALGHHQLCGGPPNRPIYFSVDEDVNLSTWNSLVLPYLNGAASVLGKEWVGVYGGQRSMWWAEEDGFRWRWQTKGWSRYDANGNWNIALPVQWVDGVQIRQVRVDEDRINGIGIDVNTTHAEDFGQWNLATTPAKEEPAVAVPNFIEIDYYGSSHSPRNGARVTNGLLHTQEGGPADGSGAKNLADFLNRSSNGVSYHDVIGNGRVYHVVPKGRASWSVLSANPFTLNYCFAGSRAGWTRDQWLARRDDIRIAAYLMVRDAKEFGFSTVVIKPPYYKREGLSDHKYVTEELGIGDHTDVGHQFPWDVFETYVREFAEGDDDVAWTDDIKNYRGIPVDASFMMAWIDRREALNEKYLAAILDHLAGKGTAQRIKDEFQADLPPEFKD